MERDRAKDRAKDRARDREMDRERNRAGVTERGMWDKVRFSIRDNKISNTLKLYFVFLYQVENIFIFLYYQDMCAGCKSGLVSVFNLNF